MLVTPTTIAGTIGGGHLELEAIAIARQRLPPHDQVSGRFRENGRLEIRPQEEFGSAFTQHFSLGPSLGQCCGGAVDLQFERVTEAMLKAWPQDEIRFTLAIFGAGHVGRALAETLARLPCQLIWIDGREDRKSVV